MELTDEQLNELFESDPAGTGFTPEELEAYFADHCPLSPTEVHYVIHD